MMGFGKIAKLVSSGNRGSIDQLMELLSTLGLDADFRELQPDQRPMMFQKAARLAADPGARVMMLTIREARGNEIHGLMVIPLDAGAQKVVALEERTGVRSGGRVLEAPGEPNRLHGANSADPLQTELTPEATWRK